MVRKLGINKDRLGLANHGLLGRERNHCGSVGEETQLLIFKTEDSFCFFQEMLSIVIRLLPKVWMSECMAQSTTARNTYYNV